MAVGLAVGREDEQAEQGGERESKAGEGGRESPWRSGHGQVQEHGGGCEQGVLLREEGEPEQREHGAEARPAREREQARGREEDGEHVHARERCPGLNEPRAQGHSGQGRGPCRRVAQAPRDRVHHRHESHRRQHGKEPRDP